MGALYGVLIGFLVSAPTLFVGHLGATPQIFGLTFGTIALTVASSQIVNAWALERWRSAVVARAAIRALVVSMAAAALFFGALGPTFGGVVLALVALAATFSVALTNHVALAMRPWAAEAGAASGMIGFAMIGMGALLGASIGAFAATGVATIFLGFTLAAALAALADARRPA